MKNDVDSAPDGAERGADRLKLVDQVWDRHGRQYVFVHGEARLMIAIKPGSADALPWVAEVRGRRCAGDTLVAVEGGETRLLALRAAAQGLDSLTFDWAGVEQQLTVVRGL
jgi:hypothetical protein